MQRHDQLVVLLWTYDIDLVGHVTAKLQVAKTHQWLEAFDLERAAGVCQWYLQDGTNALRHSLSVQFQSSLLEPEPTITQHNGPYIASNDHQKCQIAVTLICLRLLQKDSELTFKAERPAGDPNKLGDYERALAELKAAHTLFMQLSRLDRRHNPIDMKKLQTHQQYCERAYHQGEVSSTAA